MIEGEDDQAYRVHLVRGSWGLLLARLWGKWIHAREPTYFEGGEVRKRQGARGWPVDYWDAIRNPKFEIWGQRPDDAAWRPLSRGLLADARLAGMIAAALADQLAGGSRPAPVTPEVEALDPVGRAVEALRDIVERTLPAPGRGEAAYHLLEHAQMRRDHALLALQQIDGWHDINSRDLKRLRSDGKRRLGNPGEWCRFCSVASPEEIRFP